MKVVRTITYEGNDDDTAHTLAMSLPDGVYNQGRYTMNVQTISMEGVGEELTRRLGVACAMQPGGSLRDRSVAPSMLYRANDLVEDFFWVLERGWFLKTPDGEDNPVSEHQLVSVINQLDNLRHKLETILIARRAAT